MLISSIMATFYVDEVRKATVPLIEINPAMIVQIDEGREEQMARLAEQGPLKESWSHVEARSKSFVLVESDERAREVVAALLSHESREVAFDTEGVNLSRTGEMTVIALGLCDPLSIAFVFDLMAIGRGIFVGSSGLKELLESPAIRKVSFDCRTDSEALFHQFGVTLVNVLDLQVYQLGIKIQNGKYVEGRDNGNHEFLKGLRFVSGGYLTRGEVADRSAAPPPHQEYPQQWGSRPLLDKHWQYAADDVHRIKRVLQGQRSISLRPDLLARIEKGSEAYAKVFRDAEEEETDRSSVMPI